MSPLETIQPEHRSNWELLPWHVNGTLEDDELREVERHVATCRVRRAEIEVQERLGHVVRSSEELVFSPERAFARLSRRLDEEIVKLDDGSPGEGDLEPTRPLLIQGIRARLAATQPVIRYALLAQAAAIVLLLVTFALARPRPDGFRVLSTPSELGATTTMLRVVFAEDVREAQIRQLLAGVSKGESWTARPPSGSTRSRSKETGRRRSSSFATRRW